MRRFSLIGRHGIDDRDNVKLAQTDSMVYEIDFLDREGRIRFGIGPALQQLATIGLKPTDRAIDLVILAALVFAGDTRISRSKNAQDGWTREVDLYIPVSQQDVWNGNRNRIESLLQFMTGDRWHLFFREQKCQRVKENYRTDLFVKAQLSDVSLLSGGLDSLIGAIDLMATNKKPIFVSHYWDSQTSKAQSHVIDALGKHFDKKDFKSIRVKLGFNKKVLETGETESTQRGRSFLFYALGCLVASAFDRPMVVNVPENGFIALNIPLDPLRLGALSTRTAHPHVFASTNRLTEAIGLAVSFSNPYRHLTKGEMVSNCEDLRFLRRVISDSMSCSSPAKARYKGLSARHCGYCVPCLIRRAALEKGLGVNDPTIYTVETLQDQSLQSNRAEGANVRSFQLLAKRLKDSPDIAKILVHKSGPLIHAPNEVLDYSDVFRRGLLEVDGLLQSVVAKPSNLV